LCPSRGRLQRITTAEYLYQILQSWHKRCSLLFVLRNFLTEAAACRMYAWLSSGHGRRAAPTSVHIAPCLGVLGRQQCEYLCLSVVSLCLCHLFPFLLIHLLPISGAYAVVGFLCGLCIFSLPVSCFSLRLGGTQFVTLRSVCCLSVCHNTHIYPWPI